MTDIAAGLPELLSRTMTQEIAMRLAFSAVAGTLLGIERERHGRAAGLRTTLLVCLAACIAMILSDEFYRQSVEAGTPPGGWHPDPARLGAGVLAGIGFLGAGVIIHENNHIVRGVTTAATMWFVTIIGLAFGAGAIGLGIISTAGSLIVLCIMPYLESKIRNDWYSELEVSFQSDQCSLEALVAALKPLNVKVKAVDLDDRLDERLTHARVYLKYKRRGAVSFTDCIVGAIRAVPGVTRIGWKGG